MIGITKRTNSTESVQSACKILTLIDGTKIDHLLATQVFLVNRTSRRVYIVCSFSISGVLPSAPRDNLVYADRKICIVARRK